MTASSVGVYGGTFNPIHVGHLRAAAEVADALGLATVRFVPSWSPPHKRDECIAPAADRLEWVRRAVAEDPRFVADPVEVERGGASYLVETLRHLRDELAPARLVFLVGSDAFREMGEWRDPRALFALADYAVMNRPPEAPDLAAWIPAAVRDDLEVAPDGASARHRTARTWVRSVPIRGVEVSASEIRARLRAGRSVRYLVPEAARAGIESCATYLAPSPDAEADADAKARPSAMPLDWREKADLAAEAAHDLKASRVVILEVGGIASFADAFVLASGRSDRHVQSIADAIARAAKEAGEPPIGIEGYRDGRWVLIDLADVVVHVFQEEVREHYDLERLWSDATRRQAGGES